MLLDRKKYFSIENVSMTTSNSPSIMKLWVKRDYWLERIYICILFFWISIFVTYICWNMRVALYKQMEISYCCCCSIFICWSCQQNSILNILFICFFSPLVTYCFCLKTGSKKQNFFSRIWNVKFQKMPLVAMKNIFLIIIASSIYKIK